MSNGPITVTTKPVTQPSPTNRRKSQKHFTQPDTYSAQTLNRELDFIHERLNQIAVQEPHLAPLASGATLAQVIVRLNILTQMAIDAGLLSAS